MFGSSRDWRTGRLSTRHVDSNDRLCQRVLSDGTAVSWRTTDVRTSLHRPSRMTYMARLAPTSDPLCVRDYGAECRNGHQRWSPDADRPPVKKCPISCCPEHRPASGSQAKVNEMITV